METKSWWKSLTVWATIATLAIEAFKGSLDAIGPSWAVSVAPYLTGALAIIGRFRAGEPLAIK